MKRSRRNLVPAEAVASAEVDEEAISAVGTGTKVNDVTPGRLTRRPVSPEHSPVGQGSLRWGEPLFCCRTNSGGHCGQSASVQTDSNPTQSFSSEFGTLRLP